MAKVSDDDDSQDDEETEASTAETQAAFFIRYLSFFRVTLIIGVSALSATILERTKRYRELPNSFSSGIRVNYSTLK